MSPCKSWGFPLGGGVPSGPSPGRLRSCLRNAEAQGTTEAPLSIPRLPVPLCSLTLWNGEPQGGWRGLAVSELLPGALCPPHLGQVSQSRQG